MNIFALWGEIEINRQQAEADIKAVEQQAEKSGRQMEGAFGKVTKVVGAAIKEIDKYGDKIEKFGKALSKKAAVPLAALTALMGGLAKTTADYGDRVAKQAQQIGLSVQSYQELEYAMGQNGVSTQEFEMSIGNLNQRMGMARRGNEQYRKTLEKLGFNLDELDKGAISTEESFNQIVAALADMDDGQMQAAIASDFFGTRVARRLIPAIRGGSEGINELRKRAHDLGIVMDEEAARKSELFGDTMDDLGRTMGGFSRTIGSELQAPLINIANWFTNIVAGATNWIKENPKLVRQVIIFGGAIAGVLGVLVTLGTTLVITGKIIGALGAVFNILTSKPLLIIAAIGALYLAWESDWLGIRTAVEKAWGVIEPKLDAIIEWGNKTIKTVWNWTTESLSKFLTWVQETAAPWIGGTVSTAWNWSTGKVGDFITWIKDVALPFLGGTVSTAWSWSEGTVADFIEWVQGTASPWIGDTVSTAWDWTRGKVDSFILWIKDTAWPWIDDTVKTTWDWTVKGLDWIKNLLGIGDKELKIEVPSGLGWTVKGLDWLRKLLGIGSGGEAEGPAAIEETSQAIDEAIGKAATLQELLDAIYRAEGGPGARVPYGMTDFADAGNKFSNERNQALFEQLSQGMVEGSDEYYRTAALVSAQHYWNTFQQKFPEVAGKTFDQLEPEMQQLFVLHMGRWFSPPSAHELNKNWVPNVLNALGHGDVAKEFRAGSENLIGAWLDGIYAKSGDAEQAANYIAGIFADYLVGASPPPEGPLANIDEGGANVMGAWVEGAEDGLKDGVPKLTGALENIKNLFGTIWEKVPEEIREPINKAIGYAMDLVSQAEEALFKLDEFQEELDALMGGGASPEEQAQGFMARLAAGLNDKLDQLDEPMSRLVDAVYTAGATLFEFGKALASGNWLDAFLTILMETESFAKAMELLGAVLAPMITLFDNILRPIINGLINLWNGVIDALASISIFGARPFAGLRKHKITVMETPAAAAAAAAEPDSKPRAGSGGRQVSAITGPTRDLLVDLLAPLANFGAIVAPIQDIRNILYERMPNFNALSLDFAGVGAGAIGPGVVIENITVHSSAKDGRQLARDMMDEIEREMARRVNFGIRGRGGR